MPEPAPNRYAPGQWLEFVKQEALSCLFPGVIFASLAATRWLYAHHLGVPGVARYDLILFVCLATQYLMWRYKLESTDEVKVIGVFHLLGLALELFKTQVGSWTYPEAAVFKVVTVPLYSGFLYAAVASYMCQAWRRFNLRLEGWPRLAFWPNALALAVYLNFFSHHVLPDARWLILALVVACFWRTRVHFWVRGLEYRMPLTVSFALIGFFVWIAENIGTFFQGWQYPNQRHGWAMVDLGKLSSWGLLVIVTFLVVASLKDYKAKRSSILWPKTRFRHWLSNRAKAWGLLR